MSDLKLTPSLLAMLERIEQHSGTLLMLSVTASGGQDGKLNKLRGAGYVVNCDHPSVTEGGWPAEALAITVAGRTAPSTCQVGLAGCRQGQGALGIYDQPMLQISAQTRNVWVLEALCSAAVR